MEHIVMVSKRNPLHVSGEDTDWAFLIGNSLVQLHYVRSFTMPLHATQNLKISSIVLFTPIASFNYDLIKCTSYVLKQHWLSLILKSQLTFMTMITTIVSNWIPCVSYYLVTIDVYSPTFSISYIEIMNISPQQ